MSRVAIHMSFNVRNHLSIFAFWVGVYPGMTDEMIDYMAKTIIAGLA